MSKYKEKTWDDLSPEDEEFLQSLDNIDDEAIKNSIIGYTTWMNKQFEEQLKSEITQAKLDAYEYCYRLTQKDIKFLIEKTKKEIKEK